MTTQVDLTDHTVEIQKRINTRFYNEILKNFQTEAELIGVTWTSDKANSGLILSAELRGELRIKLSIAYLCARLMTIRPRYIKADIQKAASIVFDDVADGVAELYLDGLCEQLEDQDLYLKYDANLVDENLKIQDETYLAYTVNILNRLTSK